MYSKISGLPVYPGHLSTLLLIPIISWKIVCLGKFSQVSLLASACRRPAGWEFELGAAAIIQSPGIRRRRNEADLGNSFTAYFPAKSQFAGNDSGSGGQVMTSKSMVQPAATMLGVAFIWASIHWPGWTGIGGLTGQFQLTQWQPE
jgi:hypothetical protein